MLRDWEAASEHFNLIADREVRDKFASEVARVILNFDAFVDLEGMLLAKVRSFLVDKHGEDVADEVEDLLKSRHDIERMQDVKKHEEEIEDQVPIAVGATGGAA